MISSLHMYATELEKKEEVAGDFATEVNEQIPAAPPPMVSLNSSIRFSICFSE